MDRLQQTPPETRFPFQQLLNDNNLRVIENPLRRIAEEHLIEYVRDFHAANRLGSIVDVDTLVRGALLARQEEIFTTREAENKTLTEVELAALKNEKETTIWTETRELQVVLLTCCIGSVLQGWILTSWQTGTALGIAISAAISLGVRESWRFQIASSFIPAFALLLIVFAGSESPRWLIKKGRYRDAYIVLSRLRGNSLLAARDLVFIFAQLQVETTLFMRTDQDIVQIEHQIPYLAPHVYRRQIGLYGYARRITQLFIIPRARRATLASFLVMMAQQLSGVNVFAFLASTLFEDRPPTQNDDSVGSPHWTSLLLYFAFGVANFL
ncbi:MAG: hypothetical protein Q9169_007247 [Polycauliona sp. 2 TL-2023]